MTSVRWLVQTATGARSRRLARAVVAAARQFLGSAGPVVPAATPTSTAPATAVPPTPVTGRRDGGPRGGRPRPGGPPDRRAVDRPPGGPRWWLNAVGWAAVLAAALAASDGCGPSTAYLSADRATYDALAPEYAAYVSADPTLSPDQRDRRRRTLDAWKLRLDAAAEAGGTP